MHDETRARLASLADRLDNAAAGLAADAADPAGTLAARGYTNEPPDRVQGFADRHATAAAGARAMADRCRTFDGPDAGRLLAEAEQAAHAAELGGILVGRPDPQWEPDAAEARGRMQSDGTFRQVAEPGQVPFVVLSPPASDDDAAGM